MNAGSIQATWSTEYYYWIGSQTNSCITGIDSTLATSVALYNIIYIMRAQYAHAMLTKRCQWGDTSIYIRTR